MEHAKEFLYGAAGLIVTVLLLYAGFSVYNRSKALSDYVGKQQDAGLATTKEYNLVKYDGYRINGSTAINYVKTVVNDYGVEAYIIKGTGSTATTGIIRYTSDFTAMRDVTSGACYVNPLKEYKCTVVRNVANDVVTRVELVEQ